MTTFYRPLTIEERFFGHKTIVNVPVSLPPGSLPAAFAAPVNSNPIVPDLVQRKHNSSNTASSVGTFMAKNWGYFFAGTVIIGAVYLYYKNHVEKSKENKAASSAG